MSVKNWLSPLLYLSLLFLFSCTSGEKEKTVAEDQMPMVPPDTVLKTSDGVNIALNLFEPAAGEKKNAAVILIHQGGSDRREWIPYVEKLKSQGYVVLTYDVRGHGQSTPVADIVPLFNDPVLAPRDLEAVIAYLKEMESVNPKRVAVVGASIGGNLACVAVGKMGVKTAVAISCKKSAVFNLAGGKDMTMKSIFFISSDGDQDGKRARWAEELYKLEKDPKRLEILAGSSKHGVHIFEDSPETFDDVLWWLKKTL